MVSASHNPAEDNGLKVLDADGLKLDDDLEDELEQLIWRDDELRGGTNAEVVGRRGAYGVLARYIEPIAGLAGRVDARAPDRPRLRERLRVAGRAGDPGRDRRRGPRSSTTSPMA